MIRISQSRQPIVWQIDNRYNLPGVTGQVRWNGNTKEFEVNDMYGTWQRIDPNIELQSNPDIELILQWAKEKIKQETKLKELIEKNPSVKIAYENYLKAEEQLIITTHLSET